MVESITPEYQNMFHPIYVAIDSSNFQYVPITCFRFWHAEVTFHIRMWKLSVSEKLQVFLTFDALFCVSIMNNQVSVFQVKTKTKQKNTNRDIELGWRRMLEPNTCKSRGSASVIKHNSFLIILIKASKNLLNVLSREAGLGHFLPKIGLWVQYVQVSRIGLLHVLGSNRCICRGMY